MTNKPLQIELDPLKTRKSKLYFLVANDRSLFHLKTSAAYLLGELNKERGVDRVFVDKGEEYNTMALRYCKQHKIPATSVESNQDLAEKIRPHTVGEVLAYITTKKRKGIMAAVQQLPEDSFSVNIREKL